MIFRVKNFNNIRFTKISDTYEVYIIKTRGLFYNLMKFTDKTFIIFTMMCSINSDDGLVYVGKFRPEVIGVTVVAYMSIFIF